MLAPQNIMCKMFSIIILLIINKTRKEKQNTCVLLDKLQFWPQLTQTSNFASNTGVDLIKINVDVSFAKGVKVGGPKSE